MEQPMTCWVCCVTSTSDNPVTIVNQENVCRECLYELAVIEGELGSPYEE